MKTKLGWEIINTPAGFIIRHIPCEESMELNVATVAALQGIFHDPYVVDYQNFLSAHNNLVCRGEMDGLELLQPSGEDDAPTLADPDSLS